MTVYLDICCLKRPYDDQTHARISLETTAVLALLHAVAEGRLRAVRSSTHDLENARNPDQRRAAAVQLWLDQLNPPEATPAEVVRRAQELTRIGLRSLDALHIAWAESLVADYFVTADDRILAKSDRIAAIMDVRVVGPVTLSLELAL